MALKKNKIPDIGDVVPDFSLPSTSGEEFSLKALKGKKIVLYFYPKDSTPGCTTEGLEFSKLLKEFKKYKTEVFGVSRDSLKSHDNFKCKQDFQFELLSDSEETACQIFDVIKEKNMYGRKVLGIERSTFLIGEKGQLLKAWRKVKALGHASEVLEAVKAL
ncbi:MAG: peroxiredoxin [Pseudobdellovibrionaceae bacterium]